MLFLLPLQYTWAMVANYDTHDAEDSEIHFGHHEHQTPVHQTIDNHTDLAGDTKGDSKTQTSNSHEHFGFLHMSSGEILSYELPIFAPEAKQLSFDYLFSYHTPPSYQPERPNWIAAD